MRFLSSARAISTLFLFLVPANDERLPDRVDLAAGTHVEGRVVYEDAATLVLRTGTGDKRFDMKDVKSFRSRAKLHRESFERYAALAPGAPEPLIALARICQQADLVEDARTYAWYVLLANRDNADAHALLDHKKRGASWEARAGRDGEARRGKDRWVPIERLFTDRPDWAEAQETATTHYLLRTNLGQNTAVRTALDLEGFYGAFYAVLGPELELFEVVDPLTVQLHGDHASFPPLASGRAAYTNTDKNVIEIDATAGLRFDELTHEASHQIVAATTRFSLSGKGTVPGWLDEGLAESWRAGVAGEPAHRTYALVAVNREHFALHATAKSPYDLTRVLTFEAGDFIASSRSDLKYAQAYTLVQFCLDGENGRHRRGFFEFLRGAWKGASSAQDFKRALKIDDPAFEKAWIAYARDHAR